MNKTEIFSQKIGDFIQLAEGPDGPIVVGPDDGAGLPTAGRWMNNGWNNSSGGWTNHGWSNSK